jgi:hypothetical protein
MTYRLAGISQNIKLQGLVISRDFLLEQVCNLLRNVLLAGAGLQPAP